MAPFRPILDLVALGRDVIWIALSGVRCCECDMDVFPTAGLGTTRRHSNCYANRLFLAADTLSTCLAQSVRDPRFDDLSAIWRMVLFPQKAVATFHDSVFSGYPLDLLEHRLIYESRLRGDDRILHMARHYTVDS